MTHRVVFAPEAVDDLRGLYDLIADASLPERALAYVEGLRRYCIGLAEFPKRGTRRDAIRPGLRIIGYRRRVTVAFQATGTTVIILRLLYGGRDSESWRGQDDAD
ncbi:MAG: type II toxin-antitoxin system RelE/ParE family toxin [Roseomonas sp.]|nr:type II toxin-antitoxin system RelE/ParE family toxin [Roseomonas sp.]